MVIQENKKGLRARYDKLSKKQKGVLYSMILLMCVGIASATWYVTHTASGGYEITSTSEIVFEDNFALESVDTTLRAYQKNESINISNANSPIDMNLYLNTSIVDVDDSCDNTDDVTIIASYEGTPLSQGDNTINVGSGDSNVEIELTAKKHSCPQTATTYVEITPTA